MTDNAHYILTHGKPSGANDGMTIHDASGALEIAFAEDRVANWLDSASTLDGELSMP